MSGPLARTGPREAKLARHALRLIPVRVLGRWMPREVIGLCYHVVAEGELPHIRSIYAYKTPGQFEADLLYLKRNFRIVSYPELQAAHEAGRPLGKNAVFLSFDDGFAECYSTVRPLLLRHDVPCAFFLTTGVLDNRRMLHFNKVALCVDALRRLDPSAAGEALSRIDPGLAARLRIFPAAREWMEGLDAEHHPELDEACRALGVDVSAFLRDRRPYLTTEQARQLREDGFTLGAHARMHAHLGSLADPEAVEAEIVDSCRAVAALSGSSAPVPFAFPFNANGLSRAWLGELRARHPGIGLMFGTAGLREDADFLVNRTIVDGPPRWGRPGSNLPTYLRGKYLDAAAHRPRGEDARGEPEAPRAGMPPLVSVITPCHNAAPFVGETIESVLAQSYPAVEHILVDDASSDGSWEVVERYRRAAPARVRAERLARNRGGSFARNRGAELARGDFLMFLDADDRIAPDTLAHLVAAVREHAGAIALCGWRRLRETEGGWREEPGEVPLPSRDPDRALRGWLEGASWAPTCAVLWRRDAYQEAGGWDEALSLNDDGELMMRALARGARLLHARGGMGFYRTHGSSRISVSQSFLAEDKLRSRVRVLEKLAAILAAQGRLGEFARSLGVGYHRTALLGFQNGHRELAQECLRKGEEYGAPPVVSRTWAGRLLTRVLGLEGKERLVSGFARVGLMTRQRRTVLGLQRVHAAPEAGGRRSDGPRD